MKIHPHDRTLDRLLEALAATDTRRALCHLVDCAACRERLRELLDRDPGGPGRVLAWPSRAYRAILDRVVERAQAAGIPLEREQAEAPVLLGELMLLDEQQRIGQVLEDPRFQTWALADLMLDRSREASFDDPAAGERQARLALAVIDALSPRLECRELIEDLRARGFAYLANAQRMRSDFEAADRAMARAEESLALGTHDPLERARIFDLKASLRKDQRRFPEAARLLDRAIALYRAAAETHRACRALINQASLLRTAGNPKRALRALREAVRALDPEREPRLLLCARHNLAYHLSALGRDLEAHRVFTEALPLYERFPDSWTQRRRLWLEGRILRGLGQLDAAETRLAAARRGFLDQQIAYDAALASLDLAAVYALQGRSAEQRRLVEELQPMIESHHLHREAEQALAYFRRAVEDQRATPRLVEAVLRFLDLARHDPGLRFEAPQEA